MTAGLRRCVVAGGAGAVGTMFGSLLAGEGADVCAVDTAAGAGAGATAATVPAGGAGSTRFRRGDITRPGRWLRDEMAAADLVLLAVPEQVALAAIPLASKAMTAGGVLAHTLSVQSRASAVIRGEDPGRQAVGLNPMFSPALGMAGRPVAAVVLHDGPGVRALLALVARHGGRVMEMGSAAHDRLTAATQVLTHAAVLAFGLALSELGIGIEELTISATPPHAALLALLARVVTGTPEVYFEIQSAHPGAAEARLALARGLGDLASATSSAEQFGAVLDRMRGVLGHRAGDHSARCQEIFGRLPLIPVEHA